MSKVIKGGGSPAYPPAPRAGGGGYSRPSGNRGVMSGEEVRAKSTAQEIIQRAQEEAALIRSQAEEFRQKGYEDGYAEGTNVSKAEWSETILRINRENDAKFRYFEHDLVRLAVRVAEKIIGEQLRLEPSSITQIVANALGGVRHQREIYLRVNPEDFEVVREHKYLLLEQLSRAQDIDIRPDPDVERGGCLIESETGTIEATLDKQLDAIQKILLGEA